MAVKKFYSTKAKAGRKFDAQKKKFRSYGCDIYPESVKTKNGIRLCDKRFGAGGGVSN